MSNIRIERLNNWVDSLSPDLIKKLLVECVDNLIDFEYIKFYDSSLAPYWSGNGEYIDEKEYEDNE